jgi:hypothetical protein
MTLAEGNSMSTHTTTRAAGLLPALAVMTAALLQASAPDDARLIQRSLEVASDVRIVRRVEPAALNRWRSSTQSASSVVRVRLRGDGSVAEILSVESLGQDVDLNDWNLKVAEAIKAWRFESSLPEVTVAIRLGRVAP